MRKILLSFILFLIVFMPTVPYAAFEQYAVQFNWINPGEAQAVGDKISMIAIYTGASIAGICAAGVAFCLLYLVRVTLETLRARKAYA